MVCSCLPLGEVGVRANGDFRLVARDGHDLAEGTGLAINLDALLEELLKGGDVHDLVLHRLRAVDHESNPLLLPHRAPALPHP